MKRTLWFLAPVLLLVDWSDGLEWWNASELTAVTIEQADSGMAPLFVPLTLIRSAAAKGALCLDGSLPGYHLHRGQGSGADNWIVSLEGGGWCNDIRTCIYRKTSRRGSSNHMEQQLEFSGILSNKPEQNPDFYSWNRVRIRYCDGASFTGEGYNQAAGLYFRGQRIWQAAIEELMSQGMRFAKQVLLTGCSAGGLATIHHCDGFREMFPRKTKVKCLADAGMFLDVADVSGGRTLRSFFAGVVSLQGSWRNLQRSCTSRMRATSCFFPQYVLGSVRTPIFLLNAAYDVWQIQESLATGEADPRGYWKQCKLNHSSCDANQLKFLQGFRNQMINVVRVSSMSRKNGIFINSCFSHCQTERTGTWFAYNSPTIGNKRIANAVGDWFFDRSEVKAVDCAYPCDKTCHHLVFRRTIG